MAKSDCLDGTEAAAPVSGRAATIQDVPASPAGPRREQWLEQLSSDERGCTLWAEWTVLKPSRRLALLRGIAAASDGRARKLLAAALWDEKAEVALAAVEGLVTLRDPSPISSLESVASITRVDRVAAAAAHAAERLRAQAARVIPAPGELEYWASFVDGDGAQLLMGVRPGAAGARRLATVALSDRRGIVDAWGSESVSESEIEGFRDASGRRVSPRADGRGLAADRLPEIGWVRVDGAYCGAAMAASLAVNRRDRRRLPGAWEFWRESFPAPGGQAVLEADDRAFPEGQLRRRLLQSASLVHFEGFRSWLILGEDVAPFLPSARRALAGEPEESEGLLSEVVSACLATVIRTPQRRLWRSRLRRQALLWQRRGDRVIPDLCLAAAWGLDEPNGVPSAAHPLLRAMARASLEIALGG